MSWLRATCRNDGIVENLMVDIHVSGMMRQHHIRFMKLDLGFDDLDDIEQLHSIHTIVRQRKQLDRCPPQNSVGYFGASCQLGQILLMHRRISHYVAAGRPLGHDNYVNGPSFVRKSGDRGATAQHFIIRMSGNYKGNPLDFFLVIFTSAMMQSGFRLARLNSRQNFPVSRNAGG